MCTARNHKEALAKWLMYFALVPPRVVKGKVMEITLHDGKYLYYVC